MSPLCVERFRDLFFGRYPFVCIIVLFGKALKPEQLWSLQPVIRSTPPSVSSPLVSNPIDAFIIEKLDPARISDRLPWQRIQSLSNDFLDLHGLLPRVPREVKKTAKIRIQKYPKLIDKLLADCSMVNNEAGQPG